jgi:hypothetical protein
VFRVLGALIKEESKEKENNSNTTGSGDEKNQIKTQHTTI